MQRFGFPIELCQFGFHLQGGVVFLQVDVQRLRFGYFHLVAILEKREGESHYHSVERRSGFGVPAVAEFQFRQPLDVYKRQDGGCGHKIRVDNVHIFLCRIDRHGISMTEPVSYTHLDQAKMTVSLKVDQKTKMGIITDVKNALRKSYALKINYSSTKRGEK